MAWKVEIARTAQRQIEKLDRPVQLSILKFLRERIAHSSNPRQFGRPLRGEKQGLWRYRVGDYRLICDIQEVTITVLVLAVGHRKEIYR
ncbi:MAG: type II toxin-antitoxin system mRNA interferase toxin, RelE/StbE family [Acidobacteria bacterium]|nr:MAG: type II toxin-antitoxin system mRNA interferase toxin, RelE/StbE family [Acidobacteriota bacterium]